MIEVVTTYEKAHEMLGPNSLIVCPCDYGDISFGPPDTVFMFPIYKREGNTSLIPFGSDDLIRESVALDALAELVRLHLQGKKLIFAMDRFYGLFRHWDSLIDTDWVNSFYKKMGDTFLQVFDLAVGSSYIVPTGVAIEFKTVAFHHFFCPVTDNDVSEAEHYDKAVVDHNYLLGDDFVVIEPYDPYEDLSTSTVAQEMQHMYNTLIGAYYLGRESKSLLT